MGVWRKLGLGLIVAIVAVIGLWIAALVWLPDAPPPAEGSLAQRIAAKRTWVKQRLSPASVGQGSAPLAMPVLGVRRDAIRDSWGDARDGGARAHHGTDIMAAVDTPIVAAAPGVIEKLWTSAAGGTTLYVRSPQRRWAYYYAHLSRYAPGVHEGQEVKTGDLLGFVGDTGNAGPGNYHLHFGLARTAPEQHWYQGQDVDPYPYLAGKPVAR